MFVGFWRGVVGACFEVEDAPTAGEVEAGLGEKRERGGGYWGGERGKEKVSWGETYLGDVLMMGRCEM